MNHLKSVYCLMGPTATGKTDLAIELCKTYPVEIISVDSAMVYRGMDIGTAKPTPEILDEIPHHLINILEPYQTYSVADFCEDATRLIRQIVAREKIPLLVGGTMLYFKALQQGLSELPSADASKREQLLAEANLIGWAAMHEKLKQIDPISATRIHPNDPQRIERALEVYYLTGKTLSDHFSNSSEKSDSGFHYHSIGLFPQNRALLHQRIEQRFHHMLSEGFMDEVKALMKVLKGKENVSAMHMVGYRQAYSYLMGEIDEKMMIEQAIAATRQLAKRQLTWLRRWNDVVLLDPFLEDVNACFKKMLNTSL